MKINSSIRLYGWFYNNSCKKALKKKFGKSMVRRVKKEYYSVIERAKDIGPSRLLSSYCMGAYFIALNRLTNLSPEENYKIFKDGLYSSRLFHKAMGNADSYLDPKKMRGRIKWSQESHKCQFENDWIVDILPGNDVYDLGYNYLQCGICLLCRDEGCPELASYLCRLDFVLADMMGMELKRTMTIADGGEYCDFRYKKIV